MSISRFSSDPIKVSGDGVGIYRPHCPKCGMPIHSQATVEEFGIPSKWAFWGYPGQRFIACRGELNGFSFTHFYCRVNGKNNHHLAWVKKPVETDGKQMELL